MDSVVLLNSLLLAVGLLTFFATLLWTLRETYVHEFRTADMNLFEHALESESSRGKSRIYHRRAAMQWLRVSEDYRRTSIYLSMMVANLVIAILALTCATVLALLGFIAWIVFLMASIVFISISLLDMLMLYGWLKPRMAIEKFSWHLAE